MRNYNPDALVLTIAPKDPSQDWAGAGCTSCLPVQCNEVWNSKNVKFLLGFSYEEKVGVLRRVEDAVGEVLHMVVCTGSSQRAWQKYDSPRQIAVLNLFPFTHHGKTTALPSRAGAGARGGEEPQARAGDAGRGARLEL
jgi:hypothetical protein